MTDSSAHERENDAPSLAVRAAAHLDALGGKTALAARRVGQPPASGVPLARATATRQPRDEHERAAPATADSVSLHEDDVFPAASLAKLPIAVELFRRADLKQFSLDERLDTSAEPRVGGGGVLDYLDPQTLLTLHDLCFLMLGVSDNTAANFLLDFVGMGEVNETLSRLNLSHTKLARHFMDWAARAAQRENITSAADMVALLSLIRGRALPGATQLRELLAAQQRADEVAAWLPAEAQLAHKTGALDDIFHDAGILTGPHGSCIFCIMTAEQRHLPTASMTVGRVVRALWDAWCA